MSSHGEAKKTSQSTSLLVLDFLIVGGGISGLACAIALRRVGHRVLVLEKYEDIHQEYGPGRLPPNLSKILYHWGLGEQLASIGLKSGEVNIWRQDSGEHLGDHFWSEELLKEVQGDFIVCHLNDLRELLYNTAVSHGAEVRFGAEVTAVESREHTVSLSSGEVLSADVIIGADGLHGQCRQVVLEEDSGSSSDDSRSEIDQGLNLYNAIVPLSSVASDDQLRALFEREQATVYTWFGAKRATVAFSMGNSHLGLHVFGPRDGNEATWAERAPIEGLRAALEPCEPRLRKLGSLVTSPPTCIPIDVRRPLDKWVSNRLVLVGSAAHALPAGAIQDTAMVVEDGAVLGRLFSHLRSEDQIESFLFAFQDLRFPRCSEVHANEVDILYWMTAESVEFQTARDEMMKGKRDAGLNVFGGNHKEEETQEWVATKKIYAYDAEDEADNWWVEWGLLRERARGVNVKDATPVASSVEVIAVPDTP